LVAVITAVSHSRSSVTRRDDDLSTPYQILPVIYTREELRKDVLVHSRSSEWQLEGSSVSRLCRTLSDHASIKTHVSSSSKRDFIMPAILPPSHDPRSPMQITNAVVINASNQPFKTHIIHTKVHQKEETNLEERSSFPGKCSSKTEFQPHD
jgi:hypothetical protein